MDQCMRGGFGGKCSRPPGDFRPNFSSSRSRSRQRISQVRCALRSYWDSYCLRRRSTFACVKILSRDWPRRAGVGALIFVAA